MSDIGLGIIDADASYGRKLATFFGEHGFAPEWHAEPHPLLARLPEAPPQAVLLGDGGEPQAALQTLRRIRDVSQVPCFLVVGRRDEVSEIVVLEAGADDLIDRSVPLRALLARVRAVLRRAEWGLANPGAGAGLMLDGWQLLPERRQLLRPDGSECPLTTAEFDLMRLLAESRGRAVSRDAIAEGVFRRPFRAEDRTVDNLVLRLRRKLGTAEQDSIKTVRGAGYMFAGFGNTARRVA